MTYELERQQKERQRLFELEMQRRTEYLKVYLDFMNWAHYLQFHTRHDVHSTEPAMFQRLPSSSNPAENHVPNGLEEWCRK